MYRDQEINTEEYENTTYGDLTKTQSESEDEVNCTVDQRANDSVVLERKRRRFNEKNPDEKSNNEAAPKIIGPTDDDKKNESRKA